MKYTPQAFEILGYTYRATKRQDFIGNIMPLWYKIDGTTGSFAWLSNQYHRNQLGSVHNGAILSLVEHAISETIFNYSKRYPTADQLDIKLMHTPRIPRWLWATVDIANNDGETFNVEAVVRANDPNGLPLLKASARYILPKLPKVLDDDE